MSIVYFTEEITPDSLIRIYDAHPHEPEMADLGIFASLDPVALDQACSDAVYASPDEGKAALIERMESRNGIHTVEAAAELGLGSRTYVIRTI